MGGEPGGTDQLLAPTRPSSGVEHTPVESVEDLEKLFDELATSAPAPAQGVTPDARTTAEVANPAEDIIAAADAADKMLLELFGGDDSRSAGRAGVESEKLADDPEGAE